MPKKWQTVNRNIYRHFGIFMENFSFGCDQDLFTNPALHKVGKEITMFKSKWNILLYKNACAITWHLIELARNC